ncbi:MAG: vWA domain-containing protein [Candidatus Thiodiazotropha sp.]|nr:VWA domain-containing protein [Candidatus Thiodiazotropha sp. (ex Lucina pensylvanica)]MBV2093427.1 VWA domain-containing protein [Candidatus Thiodiazotropha sp. (ex Codakia orbicularis)]
MKPTLKHRYPITRGVLSLLSVLTFATAPLCLAGAPDNSSARHAIAGETGQNMEHPKIQLAILLDTSSSMDGLIDQARNQLWRVVDEFSKAERNGKPAVLEVAVFEYGNSSLEASNGYIRKVTGLTGDLDRVSEALFSLTTNGGKEYCGQVIMKAAEQLQWSVSDREIKAIFIAGNEPFTQGPIRYNHAIDAAKAAGITVNTIYAGGHEEGLKSGWRHGALLAGGDYMSIDHNHRIAHIDAPQDQRIAELNSELNQTYLPFGNEGKAGKARQLQQDANSSSISPALLAKRTKSKAGSLYSNSRWDLVDAVEEDEVILENLDERELPSEMSGMDLEQRKAYISERQAQRAGIKQEIAELSRAREKYVAEQRTKSASNNTATINQALVSSVRKQGKEKNYSFLDD